MISTSKNAETTSKIPTNRDVKRKKLNDMNDILKKIARCNLFIQQNKDAIEVAEKLPFYKVFRLEDQMGRDIQSFNDEIKDNLNIKYGLLETLQQRIELIKADISTELQSMITIKTEQHHED